jgi:hypothetical protein
VTIKHILAMRSDDGEISLYDETDHFMASFKDGKWVADDVFEFKDIEENFYHITDDAEVLRIIAEARSILGRTLHQQ